MSYELRLAASPTCLCFLLLFYYFIKSIPENKQEKTQELVNLVQPLTHDVVT